MKKLKYEPVLLEIVELDMNTDIVTTSISTVDYNPSWLIARNQNRSVYCLLYYTLLTLQGAIPDHLSLEKVNLELQLVSCI